MVILTKTHCNKTEKGTTMKLKVVRTHALKAYAKMEIRLHAFVTSALDGDATIKTVRFPRSGRMVGPQSRSGRFGEEKNFVHILGIEIQTVLCRPVRNRK